MTTPTMNPLEYYFRQVKLYIKLPSAGAYYSEGVVNSTATGEVGIMPMTGKDEINLKNPDALLNGEALIDVIKSCVPAVSNPRLLLSNDVDAIITAIRHATYGDSLETTVECPKCKHKSSFKMDLQYAIDNMTFLEPEYVINLESGLSIFMKPYGFPEIVKSLHAQFEQTKIARGLDDTSISDDTRTAMFGKAFETIATTTYELIANSIIRIVDDSRGVNVTDPTFIASFLKNTDRNTADRLQTLITEINQIGVKRGFGVECDECHHVWESEIDFNPVNFS